MLLRDATGRRVGLHSQRGCQYSRGVSLSIALD